ncbi:FecR family protein [Marinobacter sediminum]|uniref:FecR family protein n=1 Tax=Marinobacter sediminum TaxID=256323 RepID=UPI001939C98F|nr:FecR family protein [Marinobacter sediminum]
MTFISQAAAENATVEAVTGNLQFRYDSTESWQSAEPGATLTIPVEFQTGPGTSARVSESGTSFDISANSRLALAGDGEKSDGMVTRVKQWLGTVFYDVERQPDTFKVQTPYLVATVKGTQFTIVTTDTSSFVTLKEGSLEVVDLDTGDTRLLKPGDIAGVTTEQAGIDSLQQTPDALSPAEQKLALDLATADTTFNLEDYPTDAVRSMLGNDLSANIALNLEADLGDSIGAEVGAELGSDIGVDVGAEVGADVGVDIIADLGSEVSIDVGADLGDDLGLDIGIDLGDDLGVDLVADLGDDLGADIGADLGGDLGIDLGADVGDDIGVDIGIDLGDGLGVDLGLGGDEGIGLGI